jgi:hypothetical protein
LIEEIVDFVKTYEANEFRFGLVLLEKILGTDIPEPSRIFDLVLDFPPVPFLYIDRHFQRQTPGNSFRSRVRYLIFAAHRIGVPGQSSSIDTIHLCIQSVPRDDRDFMSMIRRLTTPERFRLQTFTLFCLEWLAPELVFDLFVECAEWPSVRTTEHLAAWVTFPMMVLDTEYFELALEASVKCVKPAATNVVGMQLYPTETYWLERVVVQRLLRIPMTFTGLSVRAQILCLKWLRYLAYVVPRVHVECLRWIMGHTIVVRDGQVDREFSKFVTEMVRERLAVPSWAGPRNLSNWINYALAHFAEYLTRDRLCIRALEKYIMFYIAVLRHKGLVLTPLKTPMRILTRLDDWTDVRLLKRFFARLLKKSLDSFDIDEVSAFVRGLTPEDQNLDNKVGLLLVLARNAGDKFDEVCTEENTEVVGRLYTEAGTGQGVADLFEIFVTSG